MNKWLATGWGQLGLWLATRGIAAWFWLVIMRPKTYTVLFFEGAQSVANKGLGQTLIEYPAPSVWVAQLPYLISGDNELLYHVLYVSLMFAFDAGFTWLLWREFGGRATVWWTVFVLGSGSMIPSRLDIVSAVLVGVSVVLIYRGRERVAAFVLALATGVKLWPIFLAMLLFGAKATRKSAAAIYAGTGAVLMAGTAWLGGWHRLFTPLAWQSGRGLQIESVPATPAMLLRFVKGGYRLFYSDFQAMEIAGPVVKKLLFVTDIAFGSGIVLVFGLCLWWVLVGGPKTLVPMLAVTVVSMVLVTGKTLSPQYVLWLLAVLVILVAVDSDSWLWRLHPGVLGALIAGLTTTVFPLGHVWIYAGDWRAYAMTAILALRNVLIVGVFLLSLTGSVQGLRRAQLGLGTVTTN